MTIILLIAVVGAVIVSEMRSKRTIVRIGVAILACAVCASVGVNIGRDIGDAAARNLVSIRVSDALHILKDREPNESKEHFRKLIELMSEDLPLVLLNDRKAVEFINGINQKTNPEWNSP